MMKIINAEKFFVGAEVARVPSLHVESLRDRKGAGRAPNCPPRRLAASPGQRDQSCPLTPLGGTGICKR